MKHTCSSLLVSGHMTAQLFSYFLKDLVRRYQCRRIHLHSPKKESVRQYEAEKLRNVQNCSIVPSKIKDQITLILDKWRRFKMTTMTDSPSLKFHFLGNKNLQNRNFLSHIIMHTVLNQLG